MSIHDKAYDGSLKPDELQSYLDTLTNKSDINQPGGNMQITLLAAACMSGRLDLVRLLLNDKNKADPNAPSSHERTPLFFATYPTFNISPSVQRDIIRALIVDNAHGVDLACDEDKNTPLMNAVLQLQDEIIIQELVKAGASTTLKLRPKQKSAKELADEHGTSRHLLSKAEKVSAWKTLIDVVLSFVMLIIAYANNKSVNQALGGIAKIYKIRISEADVPKVIPKCTVARFVLLTYLYVETLG